MKRTTTIRMDDKDKKGIVRFAQEHALSFSDVMNMLARALLQKKVFLGVFPTPPIEYPPGFLEELEKDAEETYRLYKAGKIKGYTNADEAMAALLKEAKECN